MGMKVAIVGGVAGGASAAARLRRISEDVEISIFEKGDYISFANCGLPYYVGGSIKERDALFLQTPAAMKARFNIDVYVKHEIIHVDTDCNTLTVKNLETGEEKLEKYDTLILSPGSTPFIPPVEGIKSPNIFTIWNVPDVDKIQNYILENNPKTAAVIGGGFIGVEMMENLHERGINVTIIEATDHLMPPIDYDMAQLIHHHVREKGVSLMLNEMVVKFENKGTKTEISLKSGKIISADLIIWCAGVRPNTEFIKSSKIELNTRGGIVVDEEMRTNISNVYAVGDAVEVTDFISGAKTMIPLAGPANKQGRLVADNVIGAHKKYKGTQGTSIIKVFDLTLASTGHNEKQLQDKIEYLYCVTDSASHASYYPGAKNMNIKLIFTTEGKILGAQIVGVDGVDKRIDILATAIRFGGSVYDLIELELAYAPPFSSAKDPVNMAGYVATNILENNLKMAYWHEIEKVDFEKTVLLDVREQFEWEKGHIKNAVHIPLNTLRANLEKLPKDKEIIVYCAVGLRAYIAARILSNNGFENVRNLTGGFKFYNIVSK